MSLKNCELPGQKKICEMQKRMKYYENIMNDIIMKSVIWQ